MMNFVSPSSIGKSQIKAPSFNVTMLLSSVALLIAFAIVIFLAARSPGTSPDELASLLSAFP